MKTSDSKLDICGLGFLHITFSFHKTKHVFHLPEIVMKFNFNPRDCKGIVSVFTFYT